ncbi:MAG: hypothetical protein WA151_17765 [Desulfatirhabdiaceae bacterium]
MKKDVVRNVALGIVLVLLLTGLPTWSGAEMSLTEKAAVLKAGLQKKGYQVLGEPDDFNRYREVDLTEYYCAGITETCNGNNFNAPYLLAFPPEHPDQMAPAKPSFAFRLRRNEAIVLVGPTPPPCDYYSYTCFLLNRYEEGWGPADSRKIFSSLGDPLNRFVIKPGPDSFNTNIVLVFTSDKNTEKAIRSSAGVAGFSRQVINTFVIPAPLHKTNTELDKTSDTLVIGQRTALWQDGTLDGNGYLTKPGMLVFRVTPPENTQFKPLPTPKQRVRGTGTTESDYGPAVDSLKASILARYAHLAAQEITIGPAVPQSPVALQTLSNTLGDSADAAYLTNKDLFKLSDDPDDFVMVYGVNHEKSGKALYQNINLYRAFKYCGVVSAYSHIYGDLFLSFTGSASDYLPQSIGIDRLYALKIARTCNDEPFCLQVTTGGCGDGVELDDELFLAIRAYVEPETRTGPAYTELLFDRAIHFTPAPPPSLNLTSKEFTGVYTKPLEIPFSVSATTPGDVVWEAKIEYLDDACCGKMAPNWGTIAGGNGDAAFTFHASSPGSYYVTITAKDQQSKFARTEVKIWMNDEVD